MPTALAAELDALIHPGQKPDSDGDPHAQQRERRMAKYTAHRDMLVREGVIRLEGRFEDTVVIDEARLRKLNGNAMWKWLAAGLVPRRWDFKYS